MPSAHLFRCGGESSGGIDVRRRRRGSSSRISFARTCAITRASVARTSVARRSLAAWYLHVVSGACTRPRLLALHSPSHSGHFHSTIHHASIYSSATFLPSTLVQPSVLAMCVSCSACTAHKNSTAETPFFTGFRICIVYGPRCRWEIRSTVDLFLCFVIRCSVRSARQWQPGFACRCSCLN